MFNMRVDIVRKEMERRFKEVEEAQKASDDEMLDKACQLMYFMLSNDMTIKHLLALSKFEGKFKNSQIFNEIKSNIIRLFRDVFQEIKEAKHLEDKQFLSRSDGNWRSLKNRLNHPHDSTVNCIAILDELHQYIENNFDDDINGLYFTIENILNILQADYGFTIPRYYYDELNGCISKLYSHLKIRYRYEASEDADELLMMFFNSDYKYLVEVTVYDFGLSPARTHMRGPLFGTNKIEMFNRCKNLYCAIDKYLSTGKSKSVLISRLITYCTWIKRESFPKPKDKQKEQKVSQIIEEFIFNYGYFPIVNFKAGKNIPDIMSIGGISWQDSVLIELKQYIGENLTSHQLHKDIGQARDYLSIVKGANPDIADIVYLLIFYDGNERLACQESDDFPKDVKIEFIYVGKETPSKLNNRSLTV